MNDLQLVLAGLSPLVIDDVRSDNGGIRVRAHIFDVVIDPASASTMVEFGRAYLAVTPFFEPGADVSDDELLRLARDSQTVTDVIHVDAPRPTHHK